MSKTVVVRIVKGVDGSEQHYLNDQLHRLDGPAKTTSRGDKHWYKEGVLHRTDGPASEYADGTRYWFLDGLLHRSDGPAIECADGSYSWYRHNRLHREDGPATYYGGMYRYYINGARHRNDDLPAIYSKNGHALEYCKDGIQYTPAPMVKGTPPPLPSPKKVANSEDSSTTLLPKKAGTHTSNRNIQVGPAQDMVLSGQPAKLSKYVRIDKGQLVMLLVIETPTHVYALHAPLDLPLDAFNDMPTDTEFELFRGGRGIYVNVPKHGLCFTNDIAKV